MLSFTSFRTYYLFYTILVACLVNIFTDSSLDRTKRKTNFGYYNSAPRKSSSLMNLYGKL